MLVIRAERDLGPGHRLKPISVSLSCAVGASQPFSQITSVKQRPLCRQFCAPGRKSFITSVKAENHADLNLCESARVLRNQLRA